MRVWRQRGSRSRLLGVQSFESFDGVHIAYEVLGNGAVALLHHGFASDSQTNWVRTGVARALVDSGRRVVLVDARGHGRSEKPHEVEAYRGGAMVRDVQVLLDHLEISQVAFVGYSMGSFVGLRLAVSDPRVVALVLGGAGSGQASIVDRSRARAIADALVARDKSSISDATALAFRNFADATKADRRALAAIQRARSGPPPPDVLAAVRVPTLVVNGERDNLVGVLDSYARAIPGATFQLVPGDHISAVAKPEFRRAIVDFLGEI